MANSIGTSINKFSRTIGNTTSIQNPLNGVITMITGQLDTGALIFDEDGTMASCTEVNDTTYYFRTMTLDTQVDIDNILRGQY